MALILPLAAGAIGLTGGARALLDQREEEPAPPPQGVLPTRRSTLSQAAQASPETRARVEAAYKRLGRPIYEEVPTPPPAPRPAPEDPGFFGTAGDLATSATAGALDAAGGIANLSSTVPRALGLPEVSSDIARGLGTAADYVRERGLSPAAQASAERFNEKIAAESGGSILDRMGGVARAVATEPRQTANIAAEMIPLMVGGSMAGGALARASGVRPIIGAGAGEGVIAAGMSSDAIREATGGESPLTELGASAAIGTLTGLVPVAGQSILNRLANSAGSPAARATGRFLQGTDPETLLAGGVRNATNQSLPTRVASGAIREGFLEELPQSIGETGIQNLAIGQPFSEGLVEDATLGTILGSGMGAGFNIPGGLSDTAREGLSRAIDAVPAAKPDGMADDVYDGVTQRAAEAVGEAGVYTDEATAIEEAIRAEQGDVAADLFRKEGERLQRNAQRAAAEAPPEPEVEPLSPDAFPKPPRVGRVAWDKIATVAAASGARTKEQVDAVLDAAVEEKGSNFGKGYAKIARDTDWYKALPSEADAQTQTNAQPEPQADPAAEPDPEKVTTRKRYVVEEDPEAEAAEDAADAQIRQTVADIESLKEEGEEATTPDTAAVPDERRVGRLKPEEMPANINPHRAIYDAIRGVFPGSAAGNRKIGGTRRHQASNWRRAANRASRALSGVNIEGVGLNEGENALSLFNGIHLNTARMQALSSILGSESSTPALSTNPDGSQRLVEKSINSDLKKTLQDNAPEDSKRIGAAELDIFGRMDKIRKDNPEKSDQEALGDVLEETGISMQKVIDTYKSLGESLDNQFAQLEALVGRDNLLMAMYAGKKAQFNETLPALPGSKPTSEMPEAVRFGQFYRKSRRSSAGDLNIDDGRQLRDESTLAKRLESLEGKIDPKTGDPLLTAPLERIARGETLPPNAPKDRSRVWNVLTHYRNIPQSPMTKRVASALLKVMESNNLHLAEADARLNISIGQPQERDTDSGVTTGTFVSTRPPGAPDGYIGQITINPEGMTERTILHEAIHALTVSMIKAFPDHPGVKNLMTLARHIKSKHGSQKALQKINDKHGARVAGVVQTIVNKSGQVSGIELIAYALTDPGLQRWLQNTRYTGRELAGYAPRTMWHAFRVAVSRMLGTMAVPNNIMDHILDASAAVFHGASTDSRLGQAAGRRAVSLDSETFNAEDPPPPPRKPKVYPTTPKQVSKSAAMELELQRRKQEEATNSASANTSASKLQKQQREAEAKRTEKLAASVKGNVEASRAENDTTAVPSDTPVPKKDVLWTDKGLRNMMDAIHGVFAGPDRADWETGMTGLLQKGGEALVEWASERNNLAQKFVMSILIGVVDNVGANQLALNEMARAQAAVHKGNQNASTAFQSFHGLGPEAQQAALDYIDTRDPATLTSKITGENADRLIAHVKGTVAALEELGLELATIGRLPEKYIETVVVDGVEQKRVNLRPLLQPSKGDTVALGGTQITGAVKAPPYNIQAERVYNTERILGTAGAQISEVQPGQKFWRALDTNGEVYFVDTRTPPAVLKKMDLLIDNEGNSETLPYRVRGKLGTDATAVMERNKSADELRAGERASEVLPSMINTMHFWTRLLAYNTLTDTLVADSQTLGDDAYVRDAPPEEAPESKLLSADKIREAKGNRGNVDKQLTKAARVPGTWVKIPSAENSASARGQWGAMAGKWVSGPVYAAMQDQINDDPIIDNENYQTFMRIWKKNKTVWSPGTHVQNVMGNMILMYTHDIPYSHVRRSLKLLYQDWAEKNQDKYPRAKAYIHKNPLSAADRALVDEFLASGATLGQFKTADFGVSSMAATEAHIAQTEKADSGSNKALSEGLLGLEGLMVRMAKGLSKTDDALMDLYSNQDNIFRMAGYMTHLQRAIANSPDGKSTVQMKEAAATYAKESFVNYNVSAPWIRAMRGTVTPFIMFPYRMVPLIAKAAVTKPWKLATIMGSIYALNALGYALTGADEDDERSLMPEYMKEEIWGMPGIPSYVRLPFGDENKANFLPLGGLVPVATALSPDPNGIPRMFALSGPAFTAIAAAWGYDPFLKREIRNEADTFSQNAASTAGYLFRGLAPQVTVSAAKAADNQVWEGGKVGPLGAEPSAYIDLAKIAGLTIKQMDIPEARLYQSQAVARIKSDYGRARNSYIRKHLRRGDTDPSDIRDYVLQNAERMNEAIREELE